MGAPKIGGFHFQPVTAGGIVLLLGLLDDEKGGEAPKVMRREAQIRCAITGTFPARVAAQLLQSCC
jgi:hypothetical protein